MRRIVLALGITALLIPAMGALEPAEARVRWNVGADFSVGGIFFSLGFNDYDHYGHGPRYFYRTNRALNHRGYQCGSACYLDDGYSYHARSCPLLQRHFFRFGFNAGHHWNAYRHGGYGYRSYGYGPWDRGYRYDRRHDRHRRGRYDHRYDRRRGRDDHRYDRRDRGRRYDDRSDSDSNRRGKRYDRRDRDRDRRNDRGYDRRDDRRDNRRDRGGANRTRSRRRHN